MTACRCFKKDAFIAAEAKRGDLRVYFGVAWRLHLQSRTEGESSEPNGADSGPTGVALLALRGRLPLARHAPTLCVSRNPLGLWTALGAVRHRGPYRSMHGTDRDVAHQTSRAEREALVKIVAHSYKSLPRSWALMVAE